MTEQEAYRAIFAVMDPQVYGPPIAGMGGGKSHADVVECQRRLDAYRAAVRAETLREVMAKVEESETPPLTNLAPVALRVAFNDGWRAHTNAVLHSVLPALAQPEGTA